MHHGFHLLPINVSYSILFIMLPRFDDRVRILNARTRFVYRNGGLTADRNYRHP